MPAADLHRSGGDCPDMTTGSGSRTTVLCLHGGLQTGTVFRERLQRLEARLMAQASDLALDFVYVDGPFENAETGLRDWMDRRSSFPCMCAAMSIVERAMPFSGVIGFSAGATVASAIARMPGRFPGVSWFILAGAPDIDPCLCAKRLSTDPTSPSVVKTLHIVGDGDEAVKPEESLRVWERFDQAELRRHDKGHCLPTSAHDLDAYVDFIRRCSAPDDEHRLAQDEELEAMSAIFPDEFAVEAGGPPGERLCTVKMPLADLELAFRIGPSYPDTLPFIHLRHSMSLSQFPPVLASGLLKAARSAAVELSGTAMLYEVASAALRFLEDAPAQPPTDALSTGGNDDRLSRNARGEWRHTVGLVGKPSAGKSTLFNCATRSLNAKMAAHPFTTIEANVGHGVWRSPDFEDRLLPLLVKDVAGLVPGAYEGRGRGNQFLNDLCDADVLIHVVDGSGLSDVDGNIIPDDGSDLGQDPLRDVAWVRNELHQWIFSNILRKWPSIVKRPRRLLSMFSGYRASRSLVQRAIRAGGLNVDVDPCSAKTQWTEAALHRVVDAFLQARFPIVLALNKADLSTATVHIKRVQDVIGNHAVAVSAGVELWLQQKARQGRLSYEFGLPSFRCLGTSDFDEDDKRRLSQAAHVFDTWGTTGVLQALTAAVMTRPPVLCYPVADLDTRAPLIADEPCIMMKPGSTVDDLFDVLRHNAQRAALDGQFVRAEAMALDGSSRKAIRRDAEIGPQCAVIRLWTTRKSRWQHHADRQDASESR
ncbi:unnamed protein product (mitochondrion) [Plasmodiophora brassicae]|uniref:OBG-type G domain-containing protein n=1 Tax=Plasmodiophora brassicae TaxID=37360 RepID=A0A3P3YCS4_PLABS|nr:unnamed protein product [Plasmodiophora brassicae]